jgi:adhesin/invasin
LTAISATSFTVTVKADGPGMVVASILPGVVASTGDAMTPEARDNQVEYVLPLELVPTALTVEDAPATSAEDEVTSLLTPDAPVNVRAAAAGDVTLAPDRLVIVHSSRPVMASVTAVPDDAAAGDRAASVAHVVVSDDPNFDGLLLPNVTVTILDRDGPPPTPSVEIVKRAWRWTEPGIPAYADLVANETLAIPTGSLLAEGATIWWTYEVVNSGEVPLTQVKVTDPELGLPGNLVCELPELPVGARGGCAASGRLTKRLRPV